MIVLCFLSLSNVTAQEKSDSIVLPTVWVQQAAQDLVRFDACKEENNLLKESVQITQSQYESEQKKTLVLQDRINDVEELNYRCNANTKMLNDAFLENDLSWRDKYSRAQRKGKVKPIVGTIAGVGIGILIGFLIK